MGYVPRKPRGLLSINLTEKCYSWSTQLNENSYKASFRLCNIHFSCARGEIVNVKEHVYTQSQMTVTSNSELNTFFKYFSKTQTFPLKLRTRLLLRNIPSIYQLIKQSLS